MHNPVLSIFSSEFDDFVSGEKEVIALYDNPVGVGAKVVSPDRGTVIGYVAAVRDIKRPIDLPDRDRYGRLLEYRRLILTTGDALTVSWYPGFSKYNDHQILVLTMNYTAWLTTPYLIAKNILGDSYADALEGMEEFLVRWAPNTKLIRGKHPKIEVNGDVFDIYPNNWSPGNKYWAFDDIWPNSKANDAIVSGLATSWRREL